MSHTKQKLASEIKFNFQGHEVDEDGEIQSSGTFSFEFRNLGTSPVSINGITIPSAPIGTAIGVAQIYREDLLCGERSYGAYKVRFGAGVKRLLVIEKFAVTGGDANS